MVHHHDYHFRLKGKDVGCITRKKAWMQVGELRFEATGDDSKALLAHVRKEMGHSLEGLAT